MSTTKTLGERVHLARTKAGLTRSETAKRSGMAYSTLSDIENDLSHSCRRIVALADALNVNPYWLETGKGVMDDIEAADQAVDTAKVLIEQKGRERIGYENETASKSGHAEVINDENLLRILKSLSEQQKLKLAEIAESMAKLNRAVLEDVLMKFGSPVTDEKVEKHYPPVPKHQTQ